jgi:peptidoglycan/LPS O-acetylase OafA/YrhL
MTVSIDRLTKGEQRFEQFRANKVFGGLDGLRFLSIVAVVWHHSIGEVTPFHAAKYGFLGVDLFFVISGFLIVTLLLRERDKRGTIALKAFYIRRALRILPLYYGFILTLALAYFLINKDSSFGKAFLTELPIYLSFLGNVFPVSLAIVWSLATEQQFYLIWPFFEKYLEKYIFYILALFLVINQVVNFHHVALANWLGVPYFNEITQSTFTPILLGVGLAHLLHHSSTFQAFQNLLFPKYSAVLWLVALIMTCSFLPDDISGVPRLFVHGLMMLLVGSVVINEHNKLMPVLKFPPIVRIGMISYGIYLFHIYAIVVAAKLLSKVGVEQKLATFIVGLTIATLAAELSFRFYETPFLRLKNKFSLVHQNHV